MLRFNLFLWLSVARSLVVKDFEHILYLFYMQHVLPKLWEQFIYWTLDFQFQFLSIHRKIVHTNSFILFTKLNTIRKICYEIRYWNLKLINKTFVRIQKKSSGKICSPNLFLQGIRVVEYSRYNEYTTTLVKQLNICLKCPHLFVFKTNNFNPPWKAKNKQL